MEKSETQAILLANFGGPRDLEEIPLFLTELLTDRDVIRTPFPDWLHKRIFRRVAKKRAKTIEKDYEQIGGRSPIYFDTEKLASLLSSKIQAPVLTFHRYLPKTHEESLQKLRRFSLCKILPMFPQFSYATTGSIARFLSSRFSGKQRWIRSFPQAPSFVSSFQRRIRAFLEKISCKEEEAFFLFSAHGLPEEFVLQNDPYEKECQLSFQAISSAFKKAKALLCYQSKFGRGEWLKPYTLDVCENIEHICWERRKIIFVPLSFLSDHIETLFEIEKLYLPILRKKGWEAYRCPALNLENDWIEALVNILQTSEYSDAKSLIWEGR